MYFIVVQAKDASGRQAGMWEELSRACVGAVT